jgi:hypothetical protein
MDYSKEINEYLSSDKKKKSIKSNEEIVKLSKKSFLGIKTSEFGVREIIYKKIPIENVLMGWEISGGCMIFDKSNFCISNGLNSIGPLLKIEDFKKVEIKRDGTFSDSVFLDNKCIGKFNRQSIGLFNIIKDEICSVFNDSNQKEEVDVLENFSMEELVKQSKEDANKKFKSKQEALTFAKENFKKIILAIDISTIKARKFDEKLNKVSKVRISPSEAITGGMAAVGGFQYLSDIRDCLIVLELTDSELNLFDNAKDELEKLISGFITSDEAISELRKWKEKLELELISQEDYDKKKSELSKFIT